MLMDPIVIISRKGGPIPQPQMKQTSRLRGSTSNKQGSKGGHNSQKGSMTRPGSTIGREERRINRANSPLVIQQANESRAKVKVVNRPIGQQQQISAVNYQQQQVDNGLAMNSWNNTANDSYYLRNRQIQQNQHSSNKKVGENNIGLPMTTGNNHGQQKMQSQKHH